MFENCIYFNSNLLVRKINRIWEIAYSDIGLSPAHGYLLRAVLADPGCRSSDLAEKLSLAPSTISRFVEALINKGYLEKYKGEDGREIRINPTKKGIEVKHRLEAIADSLSRKMNRLIGNAALNDLNETLREMEQKIE